MADHQENKDLIEQVFNDGSSDTPKEADKVQIVEPGDGSQSKLFKNVALWSFVGGIIIGLIITFIMRAMG